jgi:hypothetical protein
VVYVVVVGLLLYKIKQLWLRVLILIVAILIPNAEDWYYRQKLENYCERDAGAEPPVPAPMIRAFLCGCEGNNECTYAPPAPKDAAA